MKGTFLGNAVRGWTGADPEPLGFNGEAGVLVKFPGLWALSFPAVCPSGGLTLGSMGPRVGSLTPGSGKISEGVDGCLGESGS